MLQHMTSKDAVFILLAITTQVVTYQLDTSSPNVPNEFCEAETFRASCPASTVVVVRRALYGRMRLGRCVLRDYGYVGCFADVVAHMDVICSGSRTCSIRIPDVMLDRANPCPKDFKTYLLISYDCMPVTTIDCKSQCNIVGHSATTTSQRPSAISSLDLTSVGFLQVDRSPGGQCLRRQLCAVILRAAPGQRINITLWDFTMRDNHHLVVKQHAHGVETCYRYATIRDTMSPARETDVCGGWRRLSHVTTSNGHELQVHFIVSLVDERLPNFLLQYQVLGCADMPAPANSWIRRHDNTMTIFCRNDDTRYDVVCRDGRWTGRIGTCATTTNSQQADDEEHDHVENANQQRTVSDGTFVAIITVLAFVMATFVLGVGLVAARRKLEEEKHRNQTSKCYKLPMTLYAKWWSAMNSRRRLATAAGLKDEGSGRRGCGSDMRDDIDDYAPTPASCFDIRYDLTTRSAGAAPPLSASQHTCAAYTGSTSASATDGQYSLSFTASLPYDLSASAADDTQQVALPLSQYRHVGCMLPPVGKFAYVAYSPVTSPRDADVTCCDGDVTGYRVGCNCALPADSGNVTSLSTTRPQCLNTDTQLPDDIQFV